MTCAHAQWALVGLAVYMHYYYKHFTSCTMPSLARARPIAPGEWRDLLEE